MYVITGERIAIISVEFISGFVYFEITNSINDNITDINMDAADAENSILRALILSWFSILFHNLPMRTAHAAFDRFVLVLQCVQEEVHAFVFV